MTTVVQLLSARPGPSRPLPARPGPSRPSRPSRPILKLVSTAADTIRHALETDESVVLAVLFGSGARNELRPTSDLDVGVLGTVAGRLAALQVSLERATGRTVDLIALETAPPLLRFEIARDGIVLVERTPHLWSDFKMHAMIDWWDWAPTARLFQQAAVARLRSGGSRGSA